MPAGSGYTKGTLLRALSLSFSSPSTLRVSISRTLLQDNGFNDEQCARTVVGSVAGLNALRRTESADIAEPMAMVFTRSNTDLMILRYANFIEVHFSEFSEFILLDEKG